jgi:hypothetical protein
MEDVEEWDGGWDPGLALKPMAGMLSGLRPTMAMLGQGVAAAGGLRARGGYASARVRYAGADGGQECKGNPVGLLGIRGAPRATFGAAGVLVLVCMRDRHQPKERK